MKRELLFFYDNETTGFVKFNLNLSHFDQPHIVQLACALVDPDSYKVVQSMSVIVKPDGWDIPEATTAIHGISTEQALDEGISERKVVGMFLSLWNKRLRIAHNEDFDESIVSIALTRFFTDEVVLGWRMGDDYCTMNNSTEIVKCPPTDKMKKSGRTGYKSPKLSEAYKHFTGEEMKDAHSALGDVMGCIEVYKHLKRIV